MQTLPVLFAMRPVLGVLLVVVVLGFVAWAAVRVVSDAITWFKDEIMDEYQDLRRKSKEKAKAERTLEDIVSDQRKGDITDIGGK